ncbi:hypothetical protein J6P04_03370 [bacterium]|nr:hypothetical protein [bacterium]
MSIYLNQNDYGNITNSYFPFAVTDSAQYRAVITYQGDGSGDAIAKTN